MTEPEQPKPCPDCGRPTAEYKDATSNYVTQCRQRRGPPCKVAAAAYRRGLRDGVEIAKKHAYADKYGSVSFYDVDAAVKAKGEA